GSLALALRALRATSLLSLGLVAVGAVAVFGAVGMIGAHDSMRRGMYADFREYLGTADVWISQPGDDLALQSFDARDLVRRVAAVPTNLGWTPGAVVMGARDHRRAWGDGDPSAIEVDLEPGASAPVVVRSIRRELGSAAAGLHVETARARIERATAVARDG